MTRTGRPRTSTARREHLSQRYTEDEIKRIQKAAERLHTSVAEFIRRAVLAAAQEGE